MLSFNIEEINKKDYKINIFYAIALLIGLVLISRLFFLQVISFKSFYERAEYSTSRISILTAPRGIISDRNGKVLATNRSAISVIVYPNKLRSKTEREKVFKILSKILKRNLKKTKRIFLNLPPDATLPIRLVSDISIEEAIQIIERQHLLTGITIQKEPIRFYPNTSLAAHVLGYTSQINQSELDERPDRKLGDIVGKFGIEKLYDDVLRGVDGKTIVEVDRFGKPIYPTFEKGFYKVNPTSGKNIKLTIDIRLQKAADEALKNTGVNAAVVVVNPNTGEILALSSYPNYDPNVFTKPVSIRTWNDLVSRKAFLNRALLGYTPGSIWKPITLISALDAMVVRPNEIFHVGGAIYLGSTRFGDWTSKEDNLNLQEALAWSRDTAFYQIGKRLRPEQIKYWGKKLGAGKKSGIELLGEEKGIVPDKRWKRKNLKEDWYPGNTLHYSIGQSFLLVTPLQAARMYSGIATGKTVPKLSLVKEINHIKKTSGKVDTFELDPALLSIVKDGLKRCVDSGTGGAARIEGLSISGKTGSAEVAGSHKTHGWFASYAPSDNPDIVVVVITEKAGHGGSVAAPIARKIYEAYVTTKTKKIEKPVQSNITPIMLEEVKVKKRFLFFRKKKP